MASPTRSTASDDDDPQPTPTLAGLLRSLLAPFLPPLYTILSFLSSPAFLRASLSALVFLAASAVLLAISTTGYLIFYYKYIPPISLSIPLYLQYGVADTVPHAMADIPAGTLVSQQAYEVRVDLEMPRTPANVETGVFMVDVRLLGAFDPVAQPPETLRQLLGNITTLGGDGYTVLQHARRPAMLRYKSRSLGLVHKALNLPWHVFGFKDLDTDRVGVTMWEKAVFKRGVGNVPKNLRLEVAAGGATTGFREFTKHHQVQVYTANLTFSARFRGLRYLVYNHRVLSFVVFSTVFYAVSITSMGLMWAWIGPSIMSPGSDRALVKQEPPSRLHPVKKDPGPAVKTEDDDDGASHGLKIEDVSDSPEQFPSGRGRVPLRYEGRQQPDQPDAAVAHEREAGEGEKADDEEEEDDAAYAGAVASTTGRFEGDSGIGTMSEGPRAGPDLVRRRSGRGSAERQ